MLSIVALVVIGFRCVNYVEGSFSITFWGIGQVLEHEFERCDAQQISYGRPNAPLMNISLPLPSRPKPFVGRKELIKQVIQNIFGTDISIVGLFGPPAFGKSSLAIHIGHGIVSMKGITVNYVDLSEFRISFEQQPHFRSHARALQISGNFEKSLGRTVNSDYLLNWAAVITDVSVLIFDNCDLVLNKWHDEFQEFVLDLKRFSKDNLKVVITSQRKISFISHFIAFEVSELSEKDSKSLLSVLHPNLENYFQNEIVELVGNCPLAIKVAVMLLKLISPTTLIQDLNENKIAVLSSSLFPRRERFNVVMDTACQYLSRNSRRAAYFFSLFPGSFDEDILSFPVFKEFRKGAKNLFERSLFEKYTHVFGERYKYHKLIKKYFREKISIGSKKSLESVFKQEFLRYYTRKFYEHLTEQAQEDQQLITTEHHNLRKLAGILMNKRDHKFSPEEIIIALLSLKQGAIDRNHSNIVLDVTLQFVEEHVSLSKACSRTSASVCTVLISDLLLTTSVAIETSYANLPCTICNKVSGPEKFINFITDDLIQLIDSSYVFCSQNDFAYVITKLTRYLSSMYVLYSSLKYYSVIFRASSGHKMTIFQYLRYFLLIIQVIQMSESYLVFYISILGSVFLLIKLIFYLDESIAYLFFVWTFFVSFYALSVVGNIVGYFSIEGNGSLVYKRLCLKCIHFTSTNSFWTAHFLNHLVCSLIYPGIPLFLATLYINSAIHLLSEDLYHFVYKHKKNSHD